jgi:hypothetical protein
MKLLAQPKTVFNDYKKVGLYVPTSCCTFKCVTEAKEKGIEFIECQNHALLGCNKINMSAKDIYNMVQEDVFVEAVILSGLDPLDSFEETIEFIDEFRKLSDMEIVIFTGYKEEEISNKMSLLSKYNGITMKVGRYDPTIPPRYDPIGEVTLATGNQYFINLTTLN